MKEYIIPDDFLDAETIASAKAQGYLHEIVRCKDCKRQNLLSCPKAPVRPDDWFCADGEEK